MATRKKPSPSKAALPFPRLLCVADIHIFAYAKHSVYDEQGIPSRLHDFGRLAHDLVQLGQQRQCRVLLIAGDLLQSAILPPMTINAAKRFMSILAAGFERVIVIPGQHDLDVKIEAGTVDHSIISPIADEVDYYATPGVGQLHVEGHEPLTYYACPWTPSTEPTYEAADIFIGHGMVSGSKDPYGYQFTRGFDKDDLWKYKFSLVGDIHQAQHFTHPASQHVILVPGQPLQVNFSSGFPSGAWVVDWKGSVPLLEFVPTTEFGHAKEYHYFLDSVPAAMRAFPNVHTRVTHPKADKKKKKGAAEEAVEQVPLIEVVQEKAKALQLQNGEWAREQIQAAYANAGQSVARVVPRRCQLSSLKVKNFQSIGSEGLVLDFTAINDNTLLISGENGTGKTAAAEALFWTFTGCMTKEVPVAEISCDYGDGPAQSEATFMVEDVEYTAVRTRKAGQLLKLYRGEEDITSNDPQAQLYNIVGYQERDFRNLMYFSLNDLSLFTNLTVTEQLAVIADLEDMSALDAMAAYLSGESTRVAELHTKLKSEQDYLLARQSKLSGDVTALEQRAALANSVDVGMVADRLRKAVKERDEKKVKLEEARATRKAAQDRLNELNQLATADALMARKREAAESELKKITEQRAIIKTNKCPTCEQTLPNLDLLTKVTQEQIAAQGRAKALQAYQPKLDEAALLGAEGDVNLANTVISTAQAEVDTLDTRIRALTESVTSAQQTENTAAQLQLMRGELEEIQKSLKPELLATYESQLSDLRLISRLLVRNNRSPVYSALLRGTYLKLLSVINDCLAGIDHSYRLSLADDYQLRVVVNGSEDRKSVKRLSGGERRLLDFAVLVGLSRYYSAVFNVGPALGLRVFDEVFVYLSDRNMQLAHAMLQELDGLNIVISNDEKLKGLFESHIRVTLNPNRTSRYTFNLK